MFEYWIVGTGRFGASSNWSGGVVPDAATSVILGAGANALVQAFHIGVQGYADTEQAASVAIAAGAALSVTGDYFTVPGQTALMTATLTADYVYNDGLVTIGVASSIYGRNSASLFDNHGIVRSTGVAFVSQAATITAGFANFGQVDAGAYSTLAIDAPRDLVGGVLGSGSWSATGPSAVLALAGDAITQLAAGVSVTLSAEGSSVLAGGQTVESSLTRVNGGAVLAVLDSRDYATTQFVEVDGTVRLGGGALSAGALIVATGGLLTGYGEVDGDVAIYGEMRVLGDGHGRSTLTLGGDVLAEGRLSGRGTIHLTGSLGLDGGDVTARTLRNDGLVYSHGEDHIGGRVVNTGKITAAGATLAIDGAVTGSGDLRIEADATLELGAGAGHGQIIIFDAATGTLVLDRPSAVRATVAGFGEGDVIDLTNVASADAPTVRWHPGTDRLVIGTGDDAVRLHLFGDYVEAGFHLADDGRGGVALTYADPDSGAAPLMSTDTGVHPFGLLLAPGLDAFV